MCFPSSENKGADQLRGYREADLRLCFRLCRLLVFPWGGSNFMTTNCNQVFVQIRICTSRNLASKLNIKPDIKCFVNEIHVPELFIFYEMLITYRANAQMTKRQPWKCSPQKPQKHLSRKYNKIIAWTILQFLFPKRMQSVLDFTYIIHINLSTTLYTIILFTFVYSA